MKNRLLSLAVIVAAVTANSTFADSYKIIVDAGSTGSRVHLFQYDETKALPVINDIFSESTKPGLSSFENNPQDAGKSLKQLLDDATQQLKNKKIAPQDVELNVIATAGMRLLSDEKQDAIYTNIKNFIAENHYEFKLGRVETLPGKMEAIYGWLDLNYLANNFQNNATTVGSIDMGGASTQIAYETSDSSKPADCITLTINGKRHTVFAKSFLGLGVDQARDAMSHDSESGYCFPAGYGNGNFNFAGCTPLFEKIIKQHEVAKEILPLDPAQKVVAFSGAYFTYNFFHSDKTPDASTFESQIQAVCTQSWAQLQQDYPQVASKYLSTYCANAVYMDELFYGNYHLQNQQLSVVSQMNGHDIDWTLGAILYSLPSIR